MNTVTIFLPVVTSFALSFICRKLNQPTWMSYVAPCAIVTLAIFAYAYAIGGYYENPFSFFENSRVTFLSFLGAGFAEFIFSMNAELSRE